MTVQLIKPYLAIFLIWSTLSSSATANLISEDKVWEFAYEHPVYKSDGVYVGYKYHLMAFKDSTLINNMIYHNLYFSDVDEPIDFSLQPIAFMREERGKIYMILGSRGMNDYREDYFYGSSSEESMIYNFNLSEGEYLNINFGDQGCWGVDKYEINWLVTSISSIDIGNNGAKVQYFSQNYPSSESKSVTKTRILTAGLEVIEGIGVTNQGLLCFPFCHDQTTGLFPEKFILNKVISNGEIIYQSQYATDRMEQTVSDGGGIAFAGDGLDINVDGSWRMEIFTPGGCRAAAYTGDGSCWIPTDQLQPGVYIARLTARNYTTTIKFAR